MTFLPFHQPDISEREIEAVSEVLRSGWLTTGPVAQRFEQAFAAAVGAPYALALNSCTAALHLALEVTGVGPGDEVIVPTMTFAATAEVVEHCGARPVLVDIDPDDHTLDVDAVARAASPQTKAVLPVDFAGQPTDLAHLIEWAHGRSIYVIEDAAHAFPAAFQGQPVGSLSDITCFSFYATKTITCGEGGMATTANEEWAQQMRRKSLHGISRSFFERSATERRWSYDVVESGWKYNLSDLAAALGLAQLERAQAMRARRREIAARYRAELQSCDALELLVSRPDRESAWHLFVIKLVPDALRIDRDRFVQELEQRGIGVSVHFIPLHMQSHFRTAYGHHPDDFPVARDAFQRSISLPIYSRMTDAQVAQVVETVLHVVAHFWR